MNDAVDQGELIIQDAEQQEIARYYGVPVRFLFKDSDQYDWLIRRLWSRLR
jgi:hypothetical protein